jgi:hypothetical protein
MHMTKGNNETPIQHSLLGATLAMAAVLAILDVATGGLIRESVIWNSKEYAVTLALVIATVGVYASDGSPGLKFSRACSRHKL